MLVGRVIELETSGWGRKYNTFCAFSSQGAPLTSPVFMFHAGLNYHPHPHQSSCNCLGTSIRKHLLVKCGAQLTAQMQTFQTVSHRPRYPNAIYRRCQLLLKSITCTLVQMGRFLAATGYVAEKMPVSLSSSIPNCTHLVEPDMCC